VVKNRKFLVDGSGESGQIRNRHLKTDAADAITVLKGKDYSLFVFCGDVVVVADVIDNERKGRRICQHVGYRRTICTD
jgi:hypothetical protein